jgi:4-diphosphocytidyl-2-C-methyl-D-erythritol kinase
VTLRLLCRHWSIEPDESELFRLASQLGSDVPFFLRGGTAWASSRGEMLRPLPALRPCWFVIVIPELTIPRKTATLYSQLTQQDFSSGARVGSIIESIKGGNIPSIRDLPNAFARPLYRIAPELEELDDLFRAVGAPGAAISGAGPAHFTILPDRPAAEAVVESLRCRLHDSYRVFSAIPTPSMPLIWT